MTDSSGADGRSALKSTNGVRESLRVFPSFEDITEPELYLLDFVGVELG
jgi:hypothetical protein